VSRLRRRRLADPALRPEHRAALVTELMTARRAVAAALRDQDDRLLADARSAVDRSKRAPGERGPVWWDDGALDLNRRMVPYTDWFAALG
jgi:hypothetical protein